MRYARRAARGLTLFGTSYDWTGATWAVDGSGWAYNVPTLGSELLTNAEFTTNITGWAAANGATLTWRDFASSPNIAPTGGLDSGGIEVRSNGVSSSAARQQPTLVVGVWYMFSSRLYSPASNTVLNVASLQMPQPVGITRQVTAEDTWETLLQTGRATSTSGDLRLRATSTTTGDAAYFDAPSFKSLTSSPFATVIGASATLTAAAKIAALTTGTQAGVVALLDSAASPANFLIGYHNGTNVVLDKSVGGTYTNLISTAVAFSANAQIEIRRPSGNTFQLWYGGTQRGTNQTVSDAGIISNTRYGLFSTYSGNTVSEFSLGGASIPFSLPGA